MARQIKKDVYNIQPAVANRPLDEIKTWLAKENVTLKGRDIPRPVLRFDEVGFPQEVVSLLCQNYQTPTPIQSVSWPVALKGRDLISIAQTGSGKTLAFIIPAILHTIEQEPRQQGEGPSVLVMLPTRELAQQVEEVARDYCRMVNLATTCLYGGAARGGQGNDLRRGVDICIATPGRLIDFLQSGETSLSRCTFLVLDEADRMLDMGFEPQIRQIVGAINPGRQTLMFSATWPKEVQDLAAAFQTEPVFLNVGSMDLSANHNILQRVEVIEEMAKRKRLIELLKEATDGCAQGDAARLAPKIIVFIEKKSKTDDLTFYLRQSGWPALCIHGDKQQAERNWVLAEFKTGNAAILLATDVAARGLDVDDVTLVVNYDYPKNSADYIHRIGRTGRRGKTGIAHTFFTMTDGPKARDLVKVLEEANQEVPVDLVQMTQRPNYSASSGYRFGRSSGSYGGRNFGQSGGGGGYAGSSFGSAGQDNRAGGLGFSMGGSSFPRGGSYGSGGGGGFRGYGGGGYNGSGGAAEYNGPSGGGGFNSRRGGYNGGGNVGGFGGPPQSNNSGW